MGCADGLRVVENEGGHGALREDDAGAAVGEADSKVAHCVADVVRDFGVEVFEEGSQGWLDDVGVVIDEKVPLLVGELGVGEFNAGDELVGGVSAGVSG